MINYETVLSSFDDKMTLMQWLQKVEEALQGAGLVSVTVTQNTRTTCVLKCKFADGASVTSASISLPKGDKGDKGDKGNTGDTGNGISSISKTGTSGLIDTYTITYTNGNSQTFTVTNGANGQAGADGVGISNVTIQADGSLIITLTNSSTVDAGNVYNIVTIDLTGGYSGTLSASDLALVKLSNTVIIDNNLKAYKYDKERVICASETLLRYSNLGVNDNSILTMAFFDIDEDTGAWSWNEGSPYVDAFNSTGASNGQVLTADGLGGASWQNAGGGSLYMHGIRIFGSSKFSFSVNIITTTNTSLIGANNDLTNLLKWFYDNNITSTHPYSASCGVLFNNVLCPVTTIAQYNNTAINIYYWDGNTNYSQQVTGNVTQSLEHIIQIM